MAFMKKWQETQEYGEITGHFEGKNPVDKFYRTKDSFLKHYADKTFKKYFFV